jgi:hypothetical protein
MDLALQERMDSVDHKIIVLDPSPTGDDVLDAALETIHTSTEPHDDKHWVKQLGGRTDLKEQLARHLVTRGILREEEHAFLWVFQSPRFPTSDPGPEASVRGRIREVVLAGAEPDARMLMLLSLINACHLTDDLFAEEERRRAELRVKDLVEGEQFGQAVGRAVADAAVAVAAVTASAFTVTVAPGAHSN